MTKKLMFLAALCAVLLLVGCSSGDQQPKRIVTRPAAPETITANYYFKGLTVPATITVSAAVKDAKPLVLNFNPQLDGQGPKPVTIPVEWLKSGSADIVLSFAPGSFRHTEYRYDFPEEWTEVMIPFFNLGIKDGQPCLTWRDERSCLMALSTAGQGDLKKLAEARRVEILQNLAPFNGGQVVIKDSSHKIVSGKLPYKTPRSVHFGGRDYQAPVFSKLIIQNPGRLSRGFTFEFQGREDQGGYHFSMQVPPGGEAVSGSLVINLSMDKACNPQLQIAAASGPDYEIVRTDPTVSFMGQPYCRGSDK